MLVSIKTNEISNLFRMWQIFLFAGLRPPRVLWNATDGQDLIALNSRNPGGNKDLEGVGP